MRTEDIARQDDEIDLFEMANLSREKTGVDGVIYVSTIQASHAPRVKWYPARPRTGAPCLSVAPCLRVAIAEIPQSFNHHLPIQVFDAARAGVEAWVSLNAKDLLDFWHNETPGWTKRSMSSRSA